MGEFLRKMSGLYELVIFTASMPNYANQIIDHIPESFSIVHRLYRQHCTDTGTIFVKELKKLGRNMKDVIMIDNNPQSFINDKQNGIPIETWISDPNDTELLKMIPLLEFLSKVNDVRDYIPKFIVGNYINYSHFYSVRNFEANKKEKDEDSIVKEFQRKSDKSYDGIGIGTQNRSEIFIDRNMNQSQLNNSQQIESKSKTQPSQISQNKHYTQPIQQNSQTYKSKAIVNNYMNSLNTSQISNYQKDYESKNYNLTHSNKNIQEQINKINSITNSFSGGKESRHFFKKREGCLYEFVFISNSYQFNMILVSN